MTESKFNLMTFGSDTMINYHLSQKLKLIGRGKFNHLTITLTLLKLNLVEILSCVVSIFSDYYNYLHFDGLLSERIL